MCTVFQIIYVINRLYIQSGCFQLIIIETNGLILQEAESQWIQDGRPIFRPDQVDGELGGEGHGHLLDAVDLHDVHGQVDPEGLAAVSHGRHLGLVFACPKAELSTCGFLMWNSIFIILHQSFLTKKQVV